MWGVAMTNLALQNPHLPPVSGALGRLVMPPRSIREVDRTLVNRVADAEDRPLVLSHLLRFPARFANKITAEYSKEHARKSRVAANQWMEDISQKLACPALALRCMDDDLRDYARMAEQDSRRLALSHHDPIAAMEAIARHVVQIGINLKVYLSRFSPAQLLTRSMDVFWWRRVLRAGFARMREAAFVALGMVHRFAARYASDEAVTRRQQQRRRNRALLEKCVAINDLDQECPLQDLVGRSVANPINRRAETMTRIAGCDAFAKTHSHTALFLTFTCPSRMHAVLSASGERNAQYDHTDPGQAQKHLTTVWSRIRAQLKRDGVLYYGMRVAEPHHDSTPHWHLCVFVAPHQEHHLVKICRAHLLREDADELGASEHRMGVIRIDPNKGSAAGYVAKYVSKNIDGHGIDQDESGMPVTESVQRVDAWASTWNIRQFQFFGTPSVSVWRELRRLNPATCPEPLREVTAAADAGDWKAYMEAMGGIQHAASAYPVKVAKAWDDAPGRYGDAKGERVIGIQVGKLTVPTRFRTWRTEFRPNPEKRLIPENSEISTRRFLPSWSSVNNCTQREVKSGGNEICSCGSGLAYKRCGLRKVSLARPGSS